MRDALFPGVAQIGQVVQEGLAHEAAKKAAKEKARLEKLRLAAEKKKKKKNNNNISSSKAKAD